MMSRLSAVLLTFFHQPPVFSPGFFEGVVGGGAGIKGKEVGEMLGTINPLLIYLAFMFIAAPLGKELKQERNLRRERKNTKQKQ